MYKVGDKVRIIRLEQCDRADTNLELGMEGIVSCVNDDNDASQFDLYGVRFSDEIDIHTKVNIEKDGSYAMYVCQLELVQEKHNNEETN